MDSTVIDLLMQLSRENAQHIAVLNGEMGGVLAQVAMIKWFIGVNVTAWVGLVAATIWKQATKK